MTLIELVVALVVVGVLLWLVNSIIPMDGNIKTIINVLVILFVCIWLLQSFGLIGSVHSGEQIRIR